ncbi:MAG TPA: hypothetical protein VF268_10260 [Gammaproteobacteria bacterium]
MKNVLLSLMTVTLVFSFQECWAGETKSEIYKDGKSGEADFNDTMYGKHVNKFKIPCLQENGELGECEASNVITIEKIDTRSVKLSIGIIGANFHQCQLEGTALKMDDGIEFRETYKNYGGKERECFLRIKLEEGKIILEDVIDNNCKRRYCGQRAHLNGVRFSVRKESIIRKSSLLIDAERGKNIEFEDDCHFSKRYGGLYCKLRYEYIKYIEDINAHVVLKRYSESAEYLLINAGSGDLLELYGEPVLSPGKRKIASVSRGGDAGYMQNVIQIVDVSGENYKVEAQVEHRMPHMDLGKLTWMSEKKIVFSGSAGEISEVTLVEENGDWVLSYVRE